MPSPSSAMLEAYRALVAAADDAVLVAEWSTARFVDANHVAIDKLGYSLEDLAEMTGGDLSEFPADQHKRLSRELIENGETRASAVPIRYKNGSVVPMDLWVKRYEVDGVRYHVNVLRDCQSETSAARTRRIARGGLLASEAFYRSLVEFADDAVCVCHFESGAIVDANPAMRAMFGYGMDALTDMVQEDLFSPAGAAELERIRRALMETGAASSTQIAMTRRSGDGFIAHVKLNVFEAGGERMVVIIVRDVTEQRTQARRLQNSYKALQQAQSKVLHAQKLAAVGEVAAGVAHEINNPAAFIRMNCDHLSRLVDQLEARDVELHAAIDANEPIDAAVLAAILERHPLDLPSLRTLVDDNREGIERITLIARDLRLFSRVDHDDLSRVDLNAVVRSTVNLLANELRYRANLTLELGELPHITAARGKLGQVMTNLLLNASHAVDGGAEPGEIQVKTHVDGSDIVLQVTDDGVGMAPELAERIFDPFFTTKPQDEGTGLGLSLCAEIIKTHRGRITVDSTLGEGSCFTVRIPTETGLTARQPTQPPPVSRRGADHRRRILIVDDDEGMARAYRRMFSELNAVVVTTGEEALEQIASDPTFDLIVCDLMMPEMDGPQLYDNIGSAAPRLLKRIVFCTGGAFTPRVRDFVARIDSPVLEKPVQLEQILELLFDG